MINIWKYCWFCRKIGDFQSKMNIACIGGAFLFRQCGDKGGGKGRQAM